MTPERWKQVEEIFQSALDLPPDERQRFVAEAGADDEGLRAQVEALIEQYEAAGDFIEAPALGGSIALRPYGPLSTTQMLAGEEDPMAGTRIGAYKIVREIGRGGMGAVYLAVRADSEFQKRVAIKLVKRGMDTDFILRRFRNERQILASLDHQNIARLLDGGTTEDGLPYFVMEYIEGQPLYRYCDSQKLTISERLRLFCQLSGAVAYAHQNLVVHRDIKPSNVLVCSDGMPKLLDFGIAKLLNPELTPDTLAPTATAMRLMTPEYASPEQVRGERATPTSDIYSLGVLLYELLTGHRPYRFPNRSPHEIARVICEEEPEHPSRAVSRTYDILPLDPSAKEATTLEFLCKTRGGSLESLRRELTGDLDNIILKAMRKEPGRRYPSVERLRDDIMRHLDGRPISAPFYFPPSARTLRAETGDPATGEKSIAILPLKLMGLRKEDDTGDNYLGIGLTDAIITRLSQLRRFAVRPTSSTLRYGHEEADAFTAGHELGVSFVVDGRIQRAGEQVRVTVQLLNVHDGATVWAGQFDEKYTDVLSLQDAISAQVAEALVPHLTGVERQLLAKRGTDNSEAFETYLRGRYHWNSFTEEGFAKAITCFYRAIALDPNFAAAYTGIADYYNWLGVYCVLPPGECFAAAKEAATKAVALDSMLAEAYSALGFAVVCRDFDWPAAEKQHRRAIELNPNYATGHVWYSFHLQMEARFDEAAVEMAHAVELDPLSPSIQQSLGWCYYQARRFNESVSVLRRLVEAEPHFALGRYSLGWVLRQVGAHEEAVAEMKKAVELSGDSTFFLSGLGSAYAAAGKVGEARSVLNTLREASARRYVSFYHLALIHCNLDEAEEALALLEQAGNVPDAWLAWVGVEPQFDLLRTHPRFANLLRRTKNPLGARLAGGVSAASAESNQNAATIVSVPASNGDAQADGQGRTPAPPALTPPPPRGTDNEEAHQLYVAGRYYSTRRTAEGLLRAIERFEDAVERDPNFALAYAELADCHALLNWYAEPAPQGAWQSAKRAALKAVEADDELAEAHASLGFVKLHYDRDWAGAEEQFRRALELKPDNPVAHRWYAFSLSAAGRHEEAVAEIKRAQEISPRSAVIATAVANVLFFAERFEEAAGQCRRAMEIDPGSLSTHIILRWCYERLGMCEEALAVYEQERAFAGDTATTQAKRAHVLASCGRAVEAREILRSLIAGRDEAWVTAYEIAVVYALLGERDEAFAWLRRAEEENAVGLTYVQVDPRVTALRGDPRFAEFPRRTMPPIHTSPDGERVADDKKDLNRDAATAEAKRQDMHGPVVVAGDANAASSRLWRRLIALAAVVVVAGLAGIALYLKIYRQAEASGAGVYPLRLTDDIATDRHPSYSPDGTRIAFSSNRDGKPEIYVMNADGNGLRRLTVNKADDDNPVWSHDGRRIAFQSKRDGNSEIYVMEADGTNQINLTNNPAEDTRPAWSPDNSRIAYGSSSPAAPQDYDIYTVRTDGTDKLKLTNDPSFDNDPAWSPDGKHIAFTSDRDNNSFEIYVMNADGSGVRNLTNSPGNDVKPAWSPDGKHIAFTSNRPTKTDLPVIYVMGAGGTDARVVSGDRTYDDEAAWSPDGRFVVYQSQRDGNSEIYVTEAFPDARGAAAHSGGTKSRSLAVLPLTTIGAEGDAQYLGVGVADLLTNKLGQLDEVTLRTSGAVRRYLGSNKSALDAGRELGVDYVLAGTIEKVGDRVQTALELTDTAQGRVMWAEKFNEEFTDISSLQLSISERVVRALSLELTSDERRRLAKRYTENSEAQQLYLAGRYHLGKRTPDGLRQAITNFEQAIEKDSRFALAYAGLADCYALLNWYLEPPPPEAWERAKQAALRAVEVDDAMAEGHVSLAFIKFHYDRDWAGAEEQFRRAISLNHNYPTAHHWYAFNLSAMGRHDEALAEIRHAQELDPRSPVIATAVANVLFHARRYDDAVEQCRKALELDPGSVAAHVVLRWAYEKKGMSEAAFAIYEKERAFAGDTPTTRAKLAHVLAAGGRTAEARKIVEELVAQRKSQWVTPYEIAVIYSLIGDRDNAFRWLAEAEKEHVVGFTFFRVDPHLENLHADPRFAALAR